MSAIQAGDSSRLGATFDGEGTNFALFSEHAEAVELCLYDRTGFSEIRRYRLPEKDGGVWHGWLPEINTDYTYGYRVYGAYDPSAGHRFNPNKLLLDPYARDIIGSFVHHAHNYDYEPVSGDDQNARLIADSRDNSAWIPKAKISNTSLNVDPPEPLRRPWERSVVYELHVKGFTQLHPGVPPLMRGTFSGLGHPRSIEYIKALGITAIELLPVHYFIDEPFLNNLGLTNYWGYNSLNFFIPHPAYLGGSEVQSFRRMVDHFHEAGIEVILDVVYNHTAEGGRLGPTLSYRGIDNLSYYQLLPEDKRHYINDSGCGNTLNVRHPRVLQLIVDSLRYWVQVMGVDGFRFDLAVILGREVDGFSSNSAFFKVLLQDPVLSRVKLIAEPWDLGPGGYQLGKFPYPFSEWNDRYRDTARRFWRGDDSQVSELARRLHGSDDLFEIHGRRPRSSVNFITSHDGYTLNDLVSYNDRHNEANREDNRDGHRGNYSCNHGTEGVTDDAAINALRRRQQCNLIATLLMSQGVPMLLAGDELSRTQRGNNNAYCQDNGINWLAWNPETDAEHPLLQLVQSLLRLRAAFPVLQASHYRHQPDDVHDDGILWYHPAGGLMQEHHWRDPQSRSLGYLLAEKSENADYLPKYLLVLLNANDAKVDFKLPVDLCPLWQALVDTECERPVCRPAMACSAVYRMGAKSLAVLAGGDLSHLII